MFLCRTWLEVYDNRDALVKERSFHCFGVGNVLVPMNCRTLGRAMCQKACCRASVEGCMNVSVSYLFESVRKNTMDWLKSAFFIAMGAIV